MSYLYASFIKIVLDKNYTGSAPHKVEYDFILACEGK